MACAPLKLVMTAASQGAVTGAKVNSGALLGRGGAGREACDGRSGAQLHSWPASRRAGSPSF